MAVKTCTSPISPETEQNYLIAGKQFWRECLCLFGVIARFVELKWIVWAVMGSEETDKTSE